VVAESYSSHLTRGLRASVVLVVCVSLTGCLQPGRVVVAERSPVKLAAEKNPQVAREITSAKQAPIPKRSVVSPPSAYLVRKGDSLYSIAWRFGLDHKMLGRRNEIGIPYVIFPGQLLALKPSAVPVLPQLAKTTKPTPRAKPTKPQTSTAKPSANAVLTEWVWPLTQKPSLEFGRHSKGMDFVVGTGKSAGVASVGAGEVVYAGNGIGGYERLIIIKHVRNLLSAYNFNGRIRVRERQQIKAGVIVADINPIGRTSQKLHFEIRRDGIPVNPRSLLK